jgi:hypothetical protein
LRPRWSRLGISSSSAASREGDAPDYEAILDVFDRLLPVWQFIEENIDGREMLPAPGGGSIDALVVLPGMRTAFEIKTPRRQGDAFAKR